MERTTFTSKLFATVLSVALAMFMFVPLEAWATGEDSLEFDTAPTEQPATPDDADTPTTPGEGPSATEEGDGEDNAGDASGDASTPDSSQDGEDASDEADGAEGDDSLLTPDDIFAAANSSSSETTKPSGSWSGNGTASSPYELDDADDLVALASQVASGESYEGVSFVLTKDIDLSDNAPWSPIGSGAGEKPDTPAPNPPASSSARTASSSDLGLDLGSRADEEPTDDTDELIEGAATVALEPFAVGGTPFSGNFDGNGHAVSNLTIKQSTGSQLGLFGTLDGAKIEDLVLKNVTIDCPNSTDVGALAGKMTNGTTIFKVRIASGTIKGQGDLGGIVGSSEGAGTISNCVNNATVTSNEGNAGGIAGSVTGRTSGTTMDISSCENTGAVSASSSIDTFGGFGGIVGRAINSVNVTSCENAAPITASSSVAGGIVGVIDASDGSSSPTIVGCRNGDKANVNGGKNGTAGGIVGSVVDAATITKNINTASTITGDSYAAGIVGLFEKAGSSPSFSMTKNVSTTPVSSLSATNKGSFVNLQEGVNATDAGIDITGNTSQAPASFNALYYATLQYAIDAAASAPTVGTASQTVKLLADVTETVTVPSDGIIALDLGGNSISQAIDSDKAPVTVLGALTLSTDGFIGTESTTADNPNEIGIFVNGATATITVNAGVVAGSKSAVTLAGGASFIMANSSTGELRSGAAGIDVTGSTNAAKSAASAEEASAISGFMSFMSAFFTPQADLTTMAANSKVTLSAGEIVGSPVIQVAEGLTPDYDITGGWYSDAMPSSYVANGYHPTLAVNDTETPYTVSNETVTYTFDSNGGSTVAPIQVDYGTTPVPRTMPTATRDGYVLEAWYANPDFSGEPVLDLPEVATANTTYYAKWVSNLSPNSVTGGMAKAGDSAPFLILLGVGAAIAIGIAVTLRARRMQAQHEGEGQE